MYCGDIYIIFFRSNLTAEGQQSSILWWSITPNLCSSFTLYCVALWVVVIVFSHISLSYFTVSGHSHDCFHAIATALTNKPRWITWVNKELVTRPQHYKSQSGSGYILWDVLYINRPVLLICTGSNNHRLALCHLCAASAHTDEWFRWQYIILKSPYTMLYCIDLYCIVLICIVLCCIVSYCIVSYCIVSYHITYHIRWSPRWETHLTHN